MNVINPNNVPHTTDRFVIITEGDLQRLRAINADIITDFHTIVTQGKNIARKCKQEGNKEQAGIIYKAVNALLVKATNLGRSQYALKHQALSNSEVVEYFNAAGISLVQTSYMKYVHERSEAWLLVTEALEEVAPGFMKKQGTGIDCARQAIRDLAAGTYKQPV